MRVVWSRSYRLRLQRGRMRSQRRMRDLPTCVCTFSRTRKPQSRTALSLSPSLPPSLTCLCVHARKCRQQSPNLFTPHPLCLYATQVDSSQTPPTTSHVGRPAYSDAVHGRRLRVCTLLSTTPPSFFFFSFRFFGTLYQATHCACNAAGPPAVRHGCTPTSKPLWLRSLAIIALFRFVSRPAKEATVHYSPPLCAAL